MPDDLATIPKLRTVELPKPEARKKPPKRIIGELLKRQHGLCATCPTKLASIKNGMVFICAPFDVDHTQALDHLGNNSPENLRCLCKACHKDKTRSDVKASAKGRRVRKDEDRHATRMKAKAKFSRDVYKAMRRAEAKLKSPRKLASRSCLGAKPKNYISPLSKEYRRKVRERMER